MAVSETISATGQATAGLAAGGRLDIDLRAIAANYRALTRLAAGRCGAVVKADAYGLGMRRVAPALAAAGCRDFFVATLDEGLALRARLPEAAIYVFNGQPPGAARRFIEARLVPVLNTPAQLADWSEAGGGPCWLHIDTGMCRLGLSPAEFQALDRSRLRRIGLSGLMTHLACAEEPAHPLNRQQLAEFRSLAATLPGLPLSIGNSAGLLLGGAFADDLARPGIALYGGRIDGRAPVREVLQLSGRVLQINVIDRPRSVGYGATATVAPPARLATVGVGYADGYLRSLGNAGFAVHAGRRLPLVGRVSMDALVVDVSSLPADGLRPGDWLTLLGGGLGIDELAALAGTIAYELLTGLGPRLARRYVD
ncbi:MAG: alanine racemase [Gammaproteobacteria bacterium]|nr:MAG: alanine racemase [Gammaproteobacteria bacterium]